jgi:hypothetical protein
MDKTDLVIIVREFVHMHGQLFEMIQTLTLRQKAIEELMEDRGDKTFQTELDTRVRVLEDGAFGQQLAQEKSAFDAGLRRVMTNLIQE